MSRLMISVAGVRGIVGEGLTPEVACRWGAAFGSLLGPGSRVIVGRDTRGSGPLIEAALSSGLRGAGCTVVRAGILPTPTIQLAVEESEAAGGVAVTASHNPLPWNALKFIRADGLFLAAEEGRALAARVRGEAGGIAWVGHDRVGGEETDGRAAAGHIEKILSLPYIDRAAIASRRFRVVVDCGGGAGSVVTPRLLESLGATVERLHCGTDGTFPRNAEPRPEHLGDLSRRVTETGADLGLAHDPDADRIVFAAGSGRVLAEEHSLALACEAILARERGGTVVTNLSTSQMIDEIAARHGARVERTPVGEANVAHRMRAVGSPIGGEGNGGVIQPGVHLARDGPAAAALLLSCLAERKVTLDDLVAGLPSFAMAKHEVHATTVDLEDLDRRLRARFGEGVADRADGLRIAWGRSWVHVRPSGTEPIVRVIAEAPTRPELEEISHAALAAVSGAGPAASH